MTGLDRLERRLSPPVPMGAMRPMCDGTHLLVAVAHTQRAPRPGQSSPSELDGRDRAGGGVPERDPTGRVGAGPRWDCANRHKGVQKGGGRHWGTANEGEDDRHQLPAPRGFLARQRGRDPRGALAPSLLLRGRRQELRPGWVHAGRAVHGRDAHDLCGPRADRLRPVPAPVGGQPRLRLPDQGPGPGRRAHQAGARGSPSRDGRRDHDRCDEAHHAGLHRPRSGQGVRAEVAHQSGCLGAPDRALSPLRDHGHSGRIVPVGLVRRQDRPASLHPVGSDHLHRRRRVRSHARLLVEPHRLLHHGAGRRRDAPHHLHPHGRPYRPGTGAG